MKISVKKIVSEIGLYLILAGLFTALVIMSNSCANQGQGPSGGPSDSIPPVILSSLPAFYETNFTGKNFEITFDEYIAADNLNDKLVISPPLDEKPDVSVRGKSVIVKIKEDFLPNRTYSFDFQDAVKDYNEGNKIESLRLIFSTSDLIDTLQISGYILDAFSLAPQPEVLVSLYAQYTDTSFTTTRPDFIAKTNAEGFFLFNNLPSINFRLFALSDEDRNLFYSKKTEKIAFSDSSLLPEVKFISKVDTLINGNDTLISEGYNEFLPEDQYIVLFQEELYDQYLVSWERAEKDHSILIFNEALTDSFKVKVLPPDVAEFPLQLVPGEIIIPFYTEFSMNRDSVLIWITDSIATTIDTLNLALSYLANDSLKQLVPITDTISLVYRKENKKNTAKKDTSETIENFFTFKTNISKKNFELNKDIVLESLSPLAEFNHKAITLQKAITDSTYEEIPFNVVFEPGEKRKIVLKYKPEGDSGYRLTVDSASIKTLTGFHNLAVEEEFRTRPADYYGTVILELKGINESMIAWLLKNNKKEDPVAMKIVNPEDKNVVFDYLAPEKYIVKLIIDRNKNGKWDTGDFEKGEQPERVYYFPKEIQVKSNWEIKEPWEIDMSKVEPKTVSSDEENKEKSK
ncbi:MAG: Ig-like domain-containing protein [Prolixibacteraceae bacterium]|nr:Ig-like domain-containing protein [Prolixibacteraceae bacterium]